jgi:hypothetical protein
LTAVIRLSSSSQSSGVYCRRKAERKPSPRGSDDNSARKAGSTSSQSGWDDESQSGETSDQSGSDDKKSDDSLSDECSFKLHKEAATDKMSVSLPKLDEVPAQIKEMM